MDLRERIEVGYRDGWRLQVDDTGILLEPSVARSKWSHSRVPGSAIRTQLEMLHSQGYFSRRGDAFHLNFADEAELGVDERVVLCGFCGWLPCSLRIEHRHSLGHPEFALTVEFRVGGTRVLPDLIGPFARLNGVFYQVPDGTRRLLEEVSGLNALPAAEKEALHKVLRRWASVGAAARDADADLDQYLTEERVVVPNSVSLDVVEDESGRVSIVPTFNDVERGAMHRAYLIENEIQDVYSVESRLGDGTSLVRVVVTPEVKTALDAIRIYRRLNARERDRVLSRPFELLPDGVDPSVIDLSLFGPRVREIGAYAATVRPFTSESRDWADIREIGKTESEEPTDVDLSDASRGIGLEVEHDDGSREFEIFDSIEEALALLARVDAAFVSQDPVVDFRGKKLPVGEPLRKALHECVRRFESADEADPQGRKKAPPEEHYKSPLIGPLPYENIDDPEYEEEDRKSSARGEYGRPSALRPEIQLKTHQKVGVRWLAENVVAGKRGALLADDMGLGKTLQALTFLAWLIESDALETGLSNPTGPWKPILVVTPVILLDVWRNELTKFFDDASFLPYEVLDSKALAQLRVAKGKEGRDLRSVLDLDRIRQNRLVIANYDAVANYGFSFAQIEWSTVVTDEAHQFKEPSTRVCQVIKTLNTPFRIAMTGTPVVNRLLDVWNLVDFLRPLLLGSQREFRDRYELKPEAGGSIEGARLLQEKLQVASGPPVGADNVVLRRSKEDELEGLPLKIERVIECPLSPDQRSVYEDLRRSAAGVGGKSRFLKMLHSLNRLLQHPALEGLIALDAEPKELIEASPKIQALLEELRKIRRAGEKALIFAIFIDMQNILKRVLDCEFQLDVQVINGQTSAAGERVRRRRHETIERFSRGHGFDLLILSPDVAGVGLTITSANHVFHFGRWWNPAREDQATDRTYRIGQERDVQVYRLIAIDPKGTFRTFDEHLDDLIAERRRTSTQFLAPASDEAADSGQLGELVFGAPLDGSSASSTVIDSAADLERLSPDRFEAFVAAWLVEPGREVFLTPYSGDGGVDVVAVSEREVICVQVKHVAERRGKIDEAAVQQIRNGSSHYAGAVFPRSLRTRRLRLMVVTNGRTTRALNAEAAQSGIDVVAGGRLVASLRHRRLSLGQVAAQESARVTSLGEMKSVLAERW